MSLSTLLLLGLVAACTPEAGKAGEDDDEASDDDDDGGGDDGGGGDLEVLGILVTPDDLVLPTGEAAQLRVTGLLPEHESVDLTASVTWSVDDEGVARVSDALDEEGWLQAVAPGVAEVQALYGDVASPEVRVQVTDATLERLSVAPARVDLAVGDSVELAATATFSDGSTGDFSSQVRWVTEDAGVARFGEGARLDAVAAGETIVRASFEDHDSDGVPVVVVAAAEPNLLVSAASGSISGGVLDLEVTVRNDGATGASDFWVDVFIDPDGTPAAGDIGEEFTLVPYAGADSTASLSFQIPVDSGDHTVVVFVDTNDDIEESDETDNLLEAALGGGTTVSGPDLVISYFDYLADDVTVLWVVDVQNQGDQDADWFYVDLFTDQASSPALYDDGDEYTTIDGIAAGDTDYADFEVETWCFGCSSWVMIDGYDNVYESDESNNVSGPLTVYSE
jgi:hypothetical protein